MSTGTGEKKFSDNFTDSNNSNQKDDRVNYQTLFKIYYQLDKVVRGRNEIEAITLKNINKFDATKAEELMGDIYGKISELWTDNKIKKDKTLLEKLALYYISLIRKNANGQSGGGEEGEGQELVPISSGVFGRLRNGLKKGVEAVAGVLPGPDIPNNTFADPPPQQPKSALSLMRRNLLKRQ